MINHRFRCIFVHIPKTAGNSVNRLFGVQWENHKDLRRYAAETPIEQFQSYFKFAIVRNPWERIFSDYNYQVKKSRPEASKLYLLNEAGEKRNFNEWLEAALSDPTRYPAESWGGEVSEGIHRFSPQIDWVTVDGKVAVDEIIRLEELSQSFVRICSALGLPPLDLPHRNGRFHWHYSRYYDDYSRELVANYYARDIELFGYRFEVPGNKLFSFARPYANSRQGKSSLTDVPPVGSVSISSR